MAEESKVGHQLSLPDFWLWVCPTGTLSRWLCDGTWSLAWDEQVSLSRAAGDICWARLWEWGSCRAPNESPGQTHAGQSRGKLLPQPVLPWPCWRQGTCPAFSLRHKLTQRMQSLVCTYLGTGWNEAKCTGTDTVSSWAEFVWYILITRIPIFSSQPLLFMHHCVYEWKDRPLAPVSRSKAYSSVHPCSWLCSSFLLKHVAAQPASLGVQLPWGEQLDLWSSAAQTTRAVLSFHARRVSDPHGLPCAGVTHMQGVNHRPSACGNRAFWPRCFVKFGRVNVQTELL